MRFDHGVTITWYPTEQDKFGDITRGAPFVTTNCALSQQSSASGQRSSSEQNDRRSTVSTGTVVHVPPGNPPIHATYEAVLPDGLLWQVVGEPSLPQSPFTGWAPGVRVILNRTTG